MKSMMSFLKNVLETIPAKWRPIIAICGIMALLGLAWMNHELIIGFFKKKQEDGPPPALEKDCACMHTNGSPCRDVYGLFENGVKIVPGPNFSVKKPHWNKFIRFFRRSDDYFLKRVFIEDGPLPQDIVLPCPTKI